MKPARAITGFLLIIAILAGSVYGCADRDAANVDPAKETEPGVSQGGNVIEPPTFEFDRKNADISEFEKDPEWLSAGKPAEDGELSENEIRVSIMDSYDGERYVSQSMSYVFETLPPIDEVAEKGIEGVSISFMLFATNNVMWDRFIETRNISQKADWAYAVKSLLKRNYEPFTMTARDNSTLLVNSIRLTATVENEDAPTDIFAVDRDFYILHAQADRMHGDEWYALDCSAITERSVEPMTEQDFLRLYATALHYVLSGDQTSADLFGIGEHCSSPEEAYASMQIELELGGKTTVLTDPESVRSFAELIDPEPHVFRVIDLDIMHGRQIDYTEEALKIIVRYSGEDEAEKEFFLCPDGSISFTEDGPKRIMSSYLGNESLSIIAEFECVYITADRFPINELASFLL